MKSPTPIHVLVDEFFAGLDDKDRTSLLEAVYAFCLQVENHHYLDRRMRSLDTEADVQSDFKKRLKYDRYAKCDFWRGMVVYLRGDTPEQARAKFNLDPQDLELCLDCITNEQYIELLKISSFQSIYRVTDAELQVVIEKARRTCKKVAERQLRWIEKVDSGFHGESELEDEAVRVAHHYAHFPDTSRILAYVIRAIYNRANHLCEYHSAESRARQRKLPEFKCSDCYTEFNHRKKVLTFAQAVNAKLKPSDPSEFYCPCCSKLGKTVQLQRIESERVYETMVVSFDHPGLTSEGRGLAERLPGAENIEKSSNTKMDLEKMTQKLRSSSATFVRILVDGDEDFEQWARDRGIQALTDPLTVGHLICEYLGIDFEKVKREVGPAMLGKPSVFAVRVDGETDMVCAQTSWDAVQSVARHYKFSDGSAMEAELGPIQVKRLGEADGGAGMNLGEIIPVV